ncbi:MAG: methylmalonyl Co-A mutase-associated GTPase MeaB, partial [Candidatus Cloacimonadaceae bacterium]|nr:methylmalonyl Co-A mutase-associated GTPase MeaB [Candidatus Cloacimonadaceae bacterium]
MTEKKRPEWTPSNAGSEFASSVVSGSSITAKPAKYQGQKNKTYDVKELINGVLANNRTHLSKAITLIESNSGRHFPLAQELVSELLPHSGASIRIGITGTPGAGKSTFIESFGLWLISQGHKVAVLAIDPSSSISKGSILGDKTRMEELSRHPNSFIRPSPSGGVLGGVARKTRESIILCEAAGYDIILV